MRLVPPAILGFFALLLASIAVPADAQRSNRQGSAIAQALYAAQATQNRLARIADERGRAQRQRIDRLDGELARARGQAQSAAAQAERNAAQTRQLQSEIERLTGELATAQEEFVQLLAERDSEYRREIAAFREAAEDITSTPEGLEALELYNRGEIDQAIEILDRLNEAQERANNIRTAASYRNTATLARDAFLRGRGSATNESLIGRYERIVALDPDYFSDWLWLRYFYRFTEDTEELLRASQRAQSLAENRAVAILMRSEDIFYRRRIDESISAQAIINESIEALEEVRELARENPDDPEAHGAYRFILSNIASNLADDGQYEEALPYLDELGEITEGFDNRFQLTPEMRDIVYRYYSIAGRVARGLGDHRRSIEFANGALAEARRLIAEDVNSPDQQAAETRYRNGEAEQLGWRLRAQSELAEFSTAMATFDELVRVLDTLVGDPTVGRSNFSFSARQMIQLIIAMDRVPGLAPSEEEYRRVLDTAVRFARAGFERDPESLDARVALSESLWWKAGDDLAAGHREQADANYVEAVELAARIATEQPEDILWQRYYWRVFKSHLASGLNQDWRRLVDDMSNWIGVARLAGFRRSEDHGDTEVTLADVLMLEDARIRAGLPPKTYGTE